MAQSPFAHVLTYPEGGSEAMPEPMEVELPSGDDAGTRENNVLKIELGDGGAVFDFNPGANKTAKSDKFTANLAEEMDETELGAVSADLIRGIKLDDDSRKDWLEQHAEGIKLLGLIVEDSKSDAGTTSAPLEGMSTVRHPLLLEAVLSFNATARGEMLPAGGPVKVRDDRPNKPGMGHNGGPPLAGAPASPAPAAQPTTPRDALADALEKDFNHYLTTTSDEYYPDTDAMLFKVGFGGIGVKKVYNCPIRRRPVSESINIEDFIVSNALTNLGNAGRITHRVKMRPSRMKRMQLLGVYRDIDLGTPQQATSPNAVDQAKAEVVGVQVQAQDPQDADYELYECNCELVLDQFAPEKFKGKQLPLPYRVTMEVDSQKILEIRRNWEEKDEQCLAKEFYVEFPYVKAFGFYGLGLLHILGNTQKTLTAAWREMVDSGMFANFPGFIYAKGAGRQLTNQFRVAPGSGVGLDIGLQRLQDAVMPLPYKDLGPAFSAFIAHVEELGQRLGGTANLNIGEGKQDAPVGTTLALIEQATKPVGAVLKRLHSAQSKEFQLLKARFKEDPESFWRFNRRPAMAWEKDLFIRALDDYDLSPVSDPNNPTSLHRAAKASTLQQIATAAPGLFDLRKVWNRIADSLEIEDPDDLLAPPQQPGASPPDPKLLMAQAKHGELQLKQQGQQLDIAGRVHEAQSDVAKQQMEMRDRQADRESRERVAMIEQQTERLRLASTLAIHSSEANSARQALTMKIGSEHALDAAQRGHDADLNAAQLGHEAGLSMAQRGHEASQSEAQREHEAELARRASAARTPK